jgi:plasmid stabilization system protein ParE
MSAPFEFTRQAIEDLDAIWRFIAKDSPDAADRVEYVIVYRPETAPLQVLAVLHSKCNLKHVLEERS